MLMFSEWYVKLYLRSRATNGLGRKSRSRSRAVKCDTALNSDDTLSYSTVSRNDFLEVRLSACAFKCMDMFRRKMKTFLFNV